MRQIVLRRGAAILSGGLSAPALDSAGARGVHPVGPDARRNRIRSKIGD